WEPWVLVTKRMLSSLAPLTAYTKLKTLLTEFEAEIRRKKSIYPEQALFTKKQRSWQNNRNQKKAMNYPRFGGNCHHCGKKGHKIHDCYQKDSNSDSERRSTNERGRQSPHREESSRSRRMEDQIWIAAETRNDSTSSTQRSMSSGRSGFSNGNQEFQH